MSGSLAEQLSRFANPETREGGAAYYREGSVAIFELGSQIVAATVAGNRPYEVTLDLDGSVVTGSCTCEAAEGSRDPCDHVWATVLAVEQHGGFGEDQPTDLQFGMIASESEDDDESEVESEVPEPAAPAPRPAPTWRALLRGGGARQGEASPVGVWDSARRIEYSLDLDASPLGGDLQIRVTTRARIGIEEWGSPEPLQVDASTLDCLPNAEDREILSCLNGAGDSHAQAWGGTRHAVDTFRVPAELCAFLLPRLAATERVFAIHREEASVPGAGVLESRIRQPLQWDDGEPYRFRLEIEALGDDYRLRGLIESGEDRLPLSAATYIHPRFLLRGGRDRPGTLARFDPRGAFDWAKTLREMGDLRIPQSAREDLAVELLSAARLPPIDLPTELTFEDTEIPPRPRLILERRPEEARQGQDRVEGRLRFEYGKHSVAWDSDATAVVDPGERLRIARDLEFEQQAIDRLPPLGFRLGRRGEARIHELPGKLLPEALRQLVAVGWAVEGDGAPYRVAGPLSAKVTSGIDWFELEGWIDFEGQRASLPTLLAAARRGEHSIELPDGSQGLLPEDWLDRFEMLASLGEENGEQIRFQRSQVAFLDALIADAPEVEVDEGFAEARRAVREFDGIEAASPAASFQGELRHYQEEGLAWLLFLERFGFGGCLADDMGLGKTVQVLAFLETRRCTPQDETTPRSPSLVVAPNSLVFNWLAEAERFAPELKVVDHTGVTRDRDPAAFANADLILTTYGTLRRDIEFLKDHEFDWVILDEAQAIKNAKSASAKAARLLCGRRRLALSGTPIENHLGELWSLFEFLNPKMLGSSATFANLAKGAATGGVGRQALGRALRPFLLRRTKGEVATELPERTEQTITVELSARERKVYDDLRDHYRQSLADRIDEGGLGRAKMHVFEALLRLRQAACHPGLLDAKRRSESSAKLDALMADIEEVIDEGHKAVVFSQFTTFLGIVRERLDAAGIVYEYLDGRTRKRGEKVERFQNDSKCPLFLVSLKAGGLGLNLTAAEYVFLLDPWWNPAVEAQAIDRAHRIGQTRHVFAYRLIARDTVEEKVLALQQTKRDLADAILGEDKSLIRTLTRDDLDLLLS